MVSITLLTDFGTSDAYVGAMKGVILSRAPEARVTDITHEIRPQALREAGFVWEQATRYFPEGCVHVAVVDPGVGTRRRVIACPARGSVFLAPDNGLLGFVLTARELRRAVSVRRPDLYLKPISRTFHGRDVFAPVAAALATGTRVEELGRPARNLRLDRLPRPSKRRRGGTLEIRGEVIYTDRFGNAITNIEPPPGMRLESLEAAAVCIRGLASSYRAAGWGRPLAIVGSSGRVEIAVAGGSAERELGIETGTPVLTRWVEKAR